MAMTLRNREVNNSLLCLETPIQSAPASAPASGYLCSACTLQARYIYEPDMAPLCRRVISGPFCRHRFCWYPLHKKICDDQNLIELWRLLLGKHVHKNELALFTYFSDGVFRDPHDLGCTGEVGSRVPCWRLRLEPANITVVSSAQANLCEVESRREMITIF